MGHTLQLSLEKNPGQSVAEAAYATKPLIAKSFPPKPAEHFGTREIS